MKTKEFVALEERLLPSFPGFAIKGSLMLIPPVEHTLRGFDFDTSGLDKNVFYLTAFYLPLCVPRKYLAFTFGHRLKGTGWHADAPGLELELTAAMKPEVRFLESLRTLDKVVEATSSKAHGSVNPHHHEALAYLLIRVGDASAGMAAFDRLLSMLDPAISWQREMADRAQALRTTLFTDLPGAQQRLRAWEMESLSNLGLVGFR